MPDPTPPAATHPRRGRPVAGEALKSRTRRAVRPTGPPTEGIPVVWSGPDGVDPDNARAVVDLAARASAALLATGASAADVVGTVLLLTRAYGLSGVHVDVTFSSVSVSYNRGPSAEPMTLLRTVRSRSQDYLRLDRLRGLVVELSKEPVSPEEARARFDEVIRAPHPYRRWVVTLATGVLAASAGALLGAGPLIIVVSLLTAALVAFVQHRLGRAGIESFFNQAVASAIPTVVALLIALVQDRAGVLQGVLPSLVVASSIVVLLAGLSVVGAAQDAIEGFYVTAGARAFEVLVLTLGIVVGITVVLALSHKLGLAMTISPDTGTLAAPAVQVVTAMVSAGAFAVSTYAAGRSVVVAALAGGVGWVVYLFIGSLGAGKPSSSAVAAFAIGVTAQLISRRLRVAAIAVTTASIVALLPGRTVYQGIFQIVSDSSGPGLYQGIATLLEAAGVGVGLAAGVSLGTYAARLVQDSRRGRRRRRAPGARA